MSFSMLEGSVGVADVCLLEPLSEDNFVENLKTRFDKNHIYTYIGSVVVSVNPYKQLPIYHKAVIQEYRGKNIYEMPPHIYAIADAAYRSMRDHNDDQCVIICGESGAGKTEASKTIMQYVAEVSGKGKEIDRVKEKLLQSNPILEAFGNAKTNRNDNSSRFGKYMDVEFDFKGDPLGGVISSYLLEKSRVVFQNAGERNFHIFYQLLASRDLQFLDELHLKPDPSSYNFLSACLSVSSINDQEDFKATRKALDTLSFPECDISFIFKMISVILNLGNFKFSKRSSKNGMNGCDVNVSEKDLEVVASLIGCERQSIIQALTTRTLSTSNETVQTELSCAEASYARDALCKALYARMLTWIISLINNTIKVSSHERMKSLGVLDIYGFEIFEHNSFEQFIINYCNEKLQQIFIDLTLKEEQAEYINEGIEWIHVDYFNNSIICELIEKNNTGLLSLLDEECLLPGDTSDLTFLTKATTMCEEHPHFESRGSGKPDKSLSTDQFRLLHYAGNVTYNVSGFLDKNNDLLFKDLSRLMYAGSHPQLKTLFPDGNPATINMKRPATAGYQFKVSVAELMKNLLSKSPNYIRCIKPNHYKKSDDFVDSLVRHQVRYLGLMENVRVKRAGYAYRQKYEDFLYRYKLLTKETWPHWRSGAVSEGVVHLMNHMSFGEDEYTMGKSKIFIANPNTLFLLESRRKQHLNDIATIISAKYRSWIARKKFKRMKASQILLAAFYKGYQERKRYNRIKKATLLLTSCVRGWKARKVVRQMREEKRRQEAATLISTYYRGWKVRKEHRQKFKSVAGPKVISFIRKALICRYLLSLKSALPSLSPIDQRWPECSVLNRNTSQLLKELYHKNRCLKYRLGCSDEKKKVMNVKLKASELFLNKKALYAGSVPREFRGDHLKVSRNAKWTKNSPERPAIFSDNVFKINRKDGKAVPHIVVLEQKALCIVDEKSYNVKSSLSLQNITSICMSPFSDCIAVLTLKRVENDSTSKKGDLIIACLNIVELVTRVIIAAKQQNHSIKVTYAKLTRTNLYGTPVEVVFTGLQKDDNNVRNASNSIFDDTKVVKSKLKIEIIKIK